MGIEYTVFKICDMCIPRPNGTLPEQLIETMRAGVRRSNSHLHRHDREIMTDKCRRCHRLTIYISSDVGRCQEHCRQRKGRKRRSIIWRGCDWLFGIVVLGLWEIVAIIDTGLTASTFTALQYLDLPQRSPSSISSPSRRPP